MTQHLKCAISLTAVFMCCGPAIGAVNETDTAPDFDEVEQSYPEVPVESIQQFVQIYVVLRTSKTV